MTAPGIARVLIATGALALSAWLGGCGRPYSDPASQITNVNEDVLTRPEISVATFNMLHGYGNRLNDDTLEERLGLLAQGIASAMPDVVILQEASVTPGKHGNVVDTLRDALNARLAGSGTSYNSVFAMANGSRLIRFYEGSAILSRFQILSADSLVYHAQAILPPEHRIALRARIRSSSGVVQIIGTHLTNTAARGGGGLKRTLQAEELIGWALRQGAGGNAGVAVIGGDFNDTPGSPTIGALLSKGARDAWTGAAPGLTGLRGSVTDPDNAADERIDYIFLLGESAAVQRAQSFLDHPFPRRGSGVLWASDHIGVMAWLKLR